MARYEYNCEKCNAEVEIVRPMSQWDDLPDTKEAGECKCENPEWRRVIRTANFVLKGPGWFKSGGY